MIAYTSEFEYVPVRFRLWLNDCRQQIGKALQGIVVSSINKEFVNSILGEGGGGGFYAHTFSFLPVNA